MASDAVQAAYDNLRQALIDDGMDEATADAKLQAVRPAQTNLVGNLADLQRAGGDVVEEDDVDLSTMTKDELLAEADTRGVSVSSSATKAEIIEALGG